MIIYKITNQINKKTYIGQTVRSLTERWNEHLKMASTQDKRQLYCAMRKYGKENFTIEEIAKASSIDELNKLEQEYIVKYDSYNNGYNMTDGGELNPMHSSKAKASHDSKMRSPEIRKQISISMLEHFKTNPVSSETRAKLAAHRKQYCFIHKDNVAIQVLKSEVDRYLEEGWIKGGKACNPDVVKQRAENRSRGVKCIDENNNVLNTFKSVKSAAEWWYNYNYSDISQPRHLMSLIKKSYSQDIFIRGLKWIYIK